MRRRIEKRPVGKARQLPADDPRNLNHPSHDEAWDELAGAIGRMQATELFQQLHPDGQHHDAITEIRRRKAD
jgi:hypothetical protein